jgi:hypothetical protein
MNSSFAASNKGRRGVNWHGRSQTTIEQANKVRAVRPVPDGQIGGDKAPEEKPRKPIRPGTPFSGVLPDDG